MGVLEELAGVVDKAKAEERARVAGILRAALAAIEHGAAQVVPSFAPLTPRERAELPVPITEAGLGDHELSAEKLLADPRVASSSVAGTLRALAVRQAPRIIVPVDAEIPQLDFSDEDLAEHDPDHGVAPVAFSADGAPPGHRWRTCEQCKGKELVLNRPGIPEICNGCFERAANAPASSTPSMAGSGRGTSMPRIPLR